MEMTRRSMMGGLVMGAAATAGMAPKANAAESCCASALAKHGNDEFYTADGTFKAAAAKEAYYEMMRFYNYPIPPKLKGDDFWVADFGLGIFTEIGMGGIFWVNHKEHNYFGHEIYLLPGQNIPEHRHMKTEAAGPKLEGWQVRHGSALIFGEGEATSGVEKHIPASHQQYAKSKNMKVLMPGEVASLAAAEEWHFMQGGDQGVIVTEYATYHDGAGLRFSHPKVTL